MADADPVLASAVSKQYSLRKTTGGPGKFRGRLTFFSVFSRQPLSDDSEELEELELEPELELLEELWLELLDEEGGAVLEDWELLDVSSETPPPCSVHSPGKPFFL